MLYVLVLYLIVLGYCMHIVPVLLFLDDTTTGRFCFCPKAFHFGTQQRLYSVIDWEKVFSLGCGLSLKSSNSDFSWNSCTHTRGEWYLWLCGH